MRSPAAAIGWEFRQRHRWGLTALGVYFLVIGAIKFLVVARGFPLRIDTPESFGTIVMGPLTVTATYALAVFSFGLSGDLAGRQSMYPTRMFSLPISTAALATWPMIYGCAAMTALWAALRGLALWPPDVVVPIVWPAFLGASLMAWTQALTWLPYGLRGVRVAAAVLCLGAIDSIALLGVAYRTSEALMVAILAPQIPLAYLTARYAVARARRGDIPDWGGIFARSARAAQSAADGQRDFRSAARAQVWYEWRLHGRSLPALVAILLPFEAAIFWTTGGTAPLAFEYLFGVLLTPILMATFVAATTRKSQAGDGYGVTPFIATRPLTSVALIGAKLEATVWSAIATWVLLLVAVPAVLVMSHNWSVILGELERLAGAIGAPRAAAVVVLTGLGLMLATWKQLVQSFYIGLTGNEWLIKGSVFAVLALLFVLGPFVEWVAGNRRVLGVLWDSLPLALAVLVALKMSAATFTALRLYRSGLMSDAALIALAASWCALVLVLYGVFAWFLLTPLFPRYVLLLIAILAIPLTRLSAAPLALAGNRHR